ncbi:hypothetical protein [Candidatus Methylomicrobium oryzae]|uniref:hypothetical protein n=1 Tax=Candidatus Methylomicrobium oryzae TaxID=2802053 RepID=UPI0019210069|nr:hypothetical protein [Methylomicrobium sp. RS1]MBL1266093.1 hypothetical protein [Methylomicrobium sp. RS1]
MHKYFPQTEHILFTESKKKLPFVYEPSRRYLDEARLAAGISRKPIDRAYGCQMSGHWFDRSQWSLLSEAHYRTPNTLFGGTLKPYEELKAENTKPSNANPAISQ